MFWYLQALLSTPRRLSENKNEDICVVEYTNENRDKVIIFNTTGSVKCIDTERDFDFNPT